MKIICIGDSLTEGDYGVFGKSGIANVKSENYPYFLAKILNADVENFGKCGYNTVAYLDYYINGNVCVSGADVIIIMLGTNGGHKETEDTEGNRSYKKLIELCKNDAPNTKIVLCTPPHTTSNSEYSNCGYAGQVEDAVKFVRKFAKEENIDLIDVALCPEFTAENEHIMQPNDGMHFGKTGYETLAKFIADNLKNILDNTQI